MAPPPTPASLMGLPASWRLKLATHKVPYDEGRTAVSLFPTCAFFRDTVLQHRTARAEFNVPIAEEDFPAELARLCTVARRSSNVRLAFTGPVGGNGTGTEPHITHLLVCAMAELGEPLTCVKEVHTQSLQQTALVPAWLKVCCPNAKKLDVGSCTLTPHPLDLPPPPSIPHTAPGSPAQRSFGGGPRPLACQHLHSVHIAMLLRGGDDDDEDDDDTDDDTDDNREQWRQHIRQQLAALPSLTSLVSNESNEWLREPALVSTSLTSLDVPYLNDCLLVAHLAVHFPNLRRLHADLLTLDDATLEALLRLPHLERLTVRGFNLQRSHAHRAWAVRHLSVDAELDVGSFARVPLDSVQSCTLRHLGHVMPSGDAQAVARVVEAVRRWGGLGTERGVWVDGSDTTALLTTLGPLLAALPAAQRREVWVRDMQGASPATLQALGQQLPGSISKLELTNCSLEPEAWPALLPSLPASIKLLQVEFRPPATEEQLVTLCGGAVRRVRVEVWLLSADTLKRVEGCLVGLGREQLVTLVNM